MTTIPNKKLDEKLQTIFTELSETLAPPEVHTVDCRPATMSTSTAFFTAGGLTPLEFHRNFVSTSTPVLFKGGARHLPAVRKWTKKYLLEQTKGKQLKVALTPQGRADALIDLQVVGDENNHGETDYEKKVLRAFLSPAEINMSSLEFFNLLSEAKKQYAEKKSNNNNNETDLVIPYMQAQNNCLLSTDDFHNIIPDLFDRPYELQEKLQRERKERLKKLKSEEEKKQEAEEDELLKDYEGPDGILKKNSSKKDSSNDNNNDDENLFTHQSVSDQCSIVNFASEIFGTLPDAANIWLGGSLSMTSLHQDWYENFYIVVRGCKLFTIVPPTDCFAVPKVRVPEGKYEYDQETKKFKVVINNNNNNNNNNNEDSDGKEEKKEENDDFFWVDFDEAKTQENGGHVFTVEVQEGDILYLPAMWQHQVQQQEMSKTDDFVCAVNFWFDMNFGHAFFLQRLMKQCLGHPDA